MKIEEYILVNQAAGCPIKVSPGHNGTRVQWTDDPLDFIILSPKAVGEFITALRAVQPVGSE